MVDYSQQTRPHALPNKRQFSRLLNGSSHVGSFVKRQFSRLFVSREQLLRSKQQTEEKARQLLQEGLRDRDVYRLQLVELQVFSSSLLLSSIQLSDTQCL